MSIIRDSLGSTEVIEDFEMLSVSSNNDESPLLDSFISQSFVEQEGSADFIRSTSVDDIQGGSTNNLAASSSENIPPESAESEYFLRMQMTNKEIISGILAQVEELKQTKVELSEENDRLLDVVKCKDKDMASIQERSQRQENGMNLLKDDIQRLLIVVRNKDESIFKMSECEENIKIKLMEEVDNLKNQLSERNAEVAVLLTRRNRYYLIIAVILVLLAFFINKLNKQNPVRQISYLCSKLC